MINNFLFMHDHRSTRTLFIAICLCLSSCQISRHPLSDRQKQIMLADPTITAYNGRYYLSGTCGDSLSNYGFTVYTSEDLVHWHMEKGQLPFPKMVLKKGGSYGTRGFWAPQLLRYQNKFVIAYTANEQIALAYNNTGYDGSFVQSKPFQPLFKDGFKHIDPFIFKDGGRYYIYYVKLDGGNKIYVSELQQDAHNGELGPVRQGIEKLCIEASEPWENTENARWPVTEGPTVLQHKGTYYLFYSANDFRNPDYAVGYATSDSPLGPWKKSGQNPIISRKVLGFNGTGHGDVLTDTKGQLFYVFHAHYDQQTVSPRKTLILPFEFKRVAHGKDTIQVDKKKTRPLLKSE